MGVGPNQGYVMRVLVALDTAANVVLGGRNDETISSRLGRNTNKWWGAAGAWVLNKIQPGHTSSAIVHDEERGQTIAEIETEAEKKGE